jgi:hypothetical protein
VEQGNVLVDSNIPRQYTLVHHIIRSTASSDNHTYTNIGQDDRNTYTVHKLQVHK